MTLTDMHISKNFFEHKYNDVSFDRTIDPRLSDQITSDIFMGIH